MKKINPLAIALAGLTIAAPALGTSASALQEPDIATAYYAADTLSLDPCKSPEYKDDERCQLGKGGSSSSSGGSSGSDSNVLQPSSSTSPTPSSSTTTSNTENPPTTSNTENPPTTSNTENPPTTSNTENPPTTSSTSITSTTKSNTSQEPTSPTTTKTSTHKRGYLNPCKNQEYKDDERCQLGKGGSSSSSGGSSGSASGIGHTITSSSSRFTPPRYPNVSSQGIQTTAVVTPVTQEAYGKSSTDNTEYGPKVNTGGSISSSFFGKIKSLFS